MRCSLNVLALLFFASCIGAAAQTSKYDLGRAATPEELKAIDVLVGPEGKELPPGSGTAKDGAKTFAQRCAMCHGLTGEGGKEKRLVGGKGTLDTPHPVKTVGSFWLYPTTVWDYINRAMPQNKPGSLTPKEVYEVTAYILFRNGIIEENTVLDAKTLPKVQMPNRDGFVPAVPVWKPGTDRH